LLQVRTSLLNHQRQIAVNPCPYGRRNDAQSADPK
jgi:hypothetical protein